MEAAIIHAPSDRAIALALYTILKSGGWSVAWNFPWISGTPDLSAAHEAGHTFIVWSKAAADSKALNEYIASAEPETISFVTDGMAPSLPAGWSRPIIDLADPEGTVALLRQAIGESKVPSLVTQIFAIGATVALIATSIVLLITALSAKFSGAFTMASERIGSMIATSEESVTEVWLSIFPLLGIDAQAPWIPVLTAWLIILAIGIAARTAWAVPALRRRLNSPEPAIPQISYWRLAEWFVVTVLVVAAIAASEYAAADPLIGGAGILPDFARQQLLVGLMIMPIPINPAQSGAILVA